MNATDIRNEYVDTNAYDFRREIFSKAPTSIHEHVVDTLASCTYRIQSEYKDYFKTAALQVVDVGSYDGQLTNDYLDKSSSILDTDVRVTLIEPHASHRIYDRNEWMLDEGIGLVYATNFDSDFVDSFLPRHADIVNICLSLYHLDMDNEQLIDCLRKLTRIGSRVVLTSPSEMYMSPISSLSGNEPIVTEHAKLLSEMITSDSFNAETFNSYTDIVNLSRAEVDRYRSDASMFSRMNENYFNQNYQVGDDNYVSLSFTTSVFKRID